MGNTLKSEVRPAYLTPTTSYVLNSKVPIPEDSILLWFITKSWRQKKSSNYIPESAFIL